MSNILLAILPSLLAFIPTAAGSCDNRCGFGTFCFEQTSCKCQEGFLDRQSLKDNIQFCQKDCANVQNTRLKNYTKCRAVNNTGCMNIAAAGYPVYRCTCSAGYEFSSLGSCTDIDECKKGTSPCGNNSECENVPGTYICPCLKGYTRANETAVCSVDDSDGASTTRPLDISVIIFAFLSRVL